MASDYTGNVSDTLPGTNRIIPAGTKHFMPLGPRANKVQAGQLFKTKSGPSGAPTHANPVGSESRIYG
jgi:hypothetical protein